MKPYGKNWDLIFGAGGFAGTITLDQVNKVLACAVGLLTVLILIFRLRREWKYRNSRKVYQQPPTEV